MRIRSREISALILVLVLQMSPNAQAATSSIAFNGLLSGCVNAFTGDNIYGNRFLAYNTTTITGININVGNYLNSNWSTTKYWIASYNSGTDRPGVILETFTADATTGSGINTLVHFTGNYTITAGTKFYIYPSVSFSSFPTCYSNSPPAANLFPNKGINVDTSTTLSNATWTKAFITGGWPGANSTSWSLNNSQAQIWQISLESGGAVAINASISLNGGARTAVYRTTQSLTVTVDTPAIVTFYNNGKKIAGCINVASTAGSAICQWKPSTRGSVQLRAQAKPISSSYTSSATNTLEVLVASRVSTR